MFCVGQKVICIDDSEPFVAEPNVLPGMDGLTKGQVYTVSAVGLRSWLDGEPCIRVAEIRRRTDYDWPFWAHRFRPVVERKTDISVFTSLLVTKKTKEPA